MEGAEVFLKRFCRHLKQIAFVVNIMISEAWVTKMVLRDGKDVSVLSQRSQTGSQFQMPHAQSARIASNSFCWKRLLCACSCLCVFSCWLNSQCSQFWVLEIRHQERLTEHSLSHWHPTVFLFWQGVYLWWKVWSLKYGPYLSFSLKGESIVMTSLKLHFDLRLRGYCCSRSGPLQGGPSGTHV